MGEYEMPLFVRTGDLRVEPYEVVRLFDVKIIQKLNEHGMLYFKGLLSEESKDSYAEIETEGANVKLSSVSEEGEEHVLFQGVVKDVKVHAEQDTYYIEVHAVSYSKLLDVKRKSRSFQDKKSTYTSLAEQVTADYDGGAVIDVVTEGAPTGKFIMQHRETDWEFLKRLASRFNTGLVCDVRFDSPKYYFGVPEIQTIELENINYTVKKDMLRFKELSENGVEGLSENDFICYEVMTERITGIGDLVTFQGKELYVFEIISVAGDGLLENYLVLTPKKGLSQPCLPNTGVVGASYGGHIIEVKNDQVKVTLDTDAGHDPGTPCFFPYSTIYSSADGSGWYCMPEIGDTVRIYFPDGEEDHAYAISSVHEQVDQDKLEESNGKGGASNNMRAAGSPGGKYSGKRDDPSVKSLRNKEGKEIRLTPDGIYIIADGTIITLTEEGVLIMTENNIEFNSKKNIILSAEDDVNIIGNNGVDLICSETTSIKLNDNVQMVGQEVMAN